MANGSVYDKIIEKGSIDAQEIVRFGIEKANKITEEITQETEKRIESLLKEAKNKSDDLIKTRLAEFEQNKKQKALASRKLIIKNTFKNVLERLKTIDDEDLKKIVVSYLKKASIKGNEVIQVNASDYTRYQRLFSSKKNQNLDLLGKALNLDKCELTLSKEEANIAGGFLVISDYFDIDNSYETILENLENELETEVADLLFESEK